MMMIIIIIVWVNSYIHSPDAYHVKSGQHQASKQEINLKKHYLSKWLHWRQRTILVGNLHIDINCKLLIKLLDSFGNCHITVL